MSSKDIIEFIEDKDILCDETWYIHATKKDINIVSNILLNGIQSASLRNTKGSHFNGKYYISLYKNEPGSEGLKLWLKDQPKFIVRDINPCQTKYPGNNFRRLFINTIIPLRMSEWHAEYHQYLYIDPSKIEAMEYSLSHITEEQSASVLKNRIIFLKEIICCMQKLEIDLPIYDLSLNKEFKKEKILSLKI